MMVWCGHPTAGAWAACVFMKLVKRLLLGLVAYYSRTESQLFLLVSRETWEQFHTHVLLPPTRPKQKKSNYFSF